MSIKFPSACVIGNPAKHSLSPLIHGYWLKKYGLQGSYCRETVAPQDLPQFIENLRQQGYVGANITVPHKEAVFQFVEKPDAIANTLQSVNTIWFDKNNILCGSSSDGIGFINSLIHQVGFKRGAYKTVLVFGAGGASRAIIFALLRNNVEKVYVYNRSAEKIIAMKAINNEFENGIVSIENEAMLSDVYSTVDMIVNTTSLGMDSISSPPQKFEICKKSVVVTDIVYTPLYTPFLIAAKAHNLQIATGLDMLLYQAARGFSQWFGVENPEVTDELHDYILRHTS